MTRDDPSSSIVVGGLIEGREGQVTSLLTGDGKCLVRPSLQREGTEMRAIRGWITRAPGSSGARASARSRGCRQGTTRHRGFG